MRKQLLFILLSAIATLSFSQNGAWYKGDLHSHSTYSDGNSTVSSIIANAESKGFTFYVLTDHDNTYTPNVGNPKHWTDTAYHSNQMILLYGTEWTTNNGHANIWNSSPFPYDEIFSANLAGQPDVAAQIVKSQGGIFSINHPLNGALLWGYDYNFEFQSMEILNGPISYLLSSNKNTITNVWEPQLLSGKRITAVGGSDMHHLDALITALYPNLGSPTTYVYSSSNNADGIIDGIRKGHVCISNSPSEPHLDFFADINQTNQFNYMMGDNIADINSSINFKVNLIGSQSNLTFQVIKNGVPLYNQPLSISPSDSSIEFSDIPGQKSFYRIELLSNGSPISWTNPIYFGYETPEVASINNNSELSKIEIYPNPTNDDVYIRNKTNEPINIKLYNIHGATLANVSSSEETIKIDLETYSKGIYFIKINDSKTFKIIKQ
ncbi:MAG: CehA/McbA family metallohydrolase [Bacteroidota bacterium]